MNMTINTSGNLETMKNRMTDRRFHYEICLSQLNSLLRVPKHLRRKPQQKPH